MGSGPLAATRFGIVVLLVFGTLVAGVSAQVGGSISGTVKDPTGGVTPGVTVTAMNTVLGTQVVVVTDAQGFYSLPKLPVGRYDLTFQIEGFKPLRRAGVVVDTDAALQVNATLEIGSQSETVMVTANQIRVDTISTQLGDVVSVPAMTVLSLNGRSYTDLLSIQPGVIPTTTIQANSVIMAGVTGTIAPSGQLNAGNVSVSGQRETANGFLVNGGDVQEHMNGGTAVVPNLDSIDEFRVLTNNFDPEHGNYNGGIISVVTNSGSDMLHSDVFEFFRNTALDARNYFSPERATFNQNQPGGTIWGPLKRQKVFFFSDYEATRTTQAIETGLIPVPSGAERAGNFADAASSLTGTVNGRYWANLLSQRLGYAVSPGEPYYFPGCTTAAQCVLPNAMIPQRAWSSPAQRLLQYIPSPNSGENQFSTGAFAKTVRDDKFAYRVDANSRLGLLSGYYFFDDYRLDNPYPGQQGGANVPGFDALTLGRAQLFAAGDNTVMRNGAVNEFHATFTRNANNVGFPNGGRGVSLASQGFVTGPATPGIVVQAPELEGVENIAFDAFTMGVTINYGMRWDVMQPWYERDNQIQTIVPGQESVVFPGAPLGLVVPGDPGIGRGLSPTRWDNVAPRVGIAYAPSEKFSVRGSYGIFYTAFQGLSAGIMYGVPPYGYNYLSPAPPLFETPFVTAADGTNNGQRFPFPPPALGASASNPVSNIDWSKFIPVNADPFFGNDNKTPYSENYMLSVQRELAPNAVATASYVGSRGHNILVIRQANPGNAALCL